MKKLMAMALMVTLLFTGIGTTASAADPCSHSFERYGQEWLPTGNGYNHPYTTSSGTTAGCAVTIKRHYDREKCTKCGAILYTPIEEAEREYHQIASHNTF